MDLLKGEESRTNKVGNDTAIGETSGWMVEESDTIRPKVSLVKSWGVDIVVVANI